MRLSSKEIEIIKKIINDIFGETTIYLFGSRLEENKKGGDVDLFVVTKDKDGLLQKKIKALAKLERALYKPVDIVVHRDFNREIEQEALKGKLL